MHEQQPTTSQQHHHSQQQPPQQQQQQQSQQTLPLSLTSHLHHQQTQLHHSHHSHQHAHLLRRSDNNATHGGGNNVNDHHPSMTGYAEEGSFMFSLPFDDSSSQLDLPSLLQANVAHHHQQQQQHMGGSPRNGTASMTWEERTKKNMDNGSSLKKRKSSGGSSEAAHDSSKPARTKKKRSSGKSTPPQDEAELLDGTNFEDSGDMFEGVGENKELKRQMRLVKNRQAAQQFRKRQKQYIQDLEKRCNALTTQNAAYGAKVELLTTENRLIKEQLDYLRSFVSQAVQVSLSPAAISAGPLQVSSALSGTLGPPVGPLSSQASPTGQSQSSSRGFSLHTTSPGGSSSGSISSKMPGAFTGSGGSPQHSHVGLGLSGAASQGSGLSSQQASQRYSSSRISQTIPPPHYQPPHPRGGLSSQMSEHHRPLI